MQVKQETEAFVSSSTKASIQKTGQEQLKAMDASLALWRGDYETFRRMEEARSAGYTARLQKVVKKWFLPYAGGTDAKGTSERNRLWGWNS